MKKRLPLFLIFALCSTLDAQIVPPALMVKVDDKSQPLGLSSVRTEVRVFGYVAQTTTTMTFFNPVPRVMEGDLYFPLPEGATISGYALDIEGKMVDGVAVEKHKGREVFEKIVRRGIDPGLVAWTRGNNFKTRVFPIPARGTRTIRVDYVTELVGGLGAPAYHLPLNFENKLREFSLRVEVVKPRAEPKITKGRLSNFAFQRWRDSFVAETSLRDVSLTEDLVVALPGVEAQDVLVERADDGAVYFALHDFPEIPQQAQAPPPKHIVIYWDASGSRASSDHQREIGLLEAYLASLARPGSAPKPDVRVDLILLRNEQSKPKRFVISGANIGKLVAELEKVQYDGGTQMGAITPRLGTKTPDLYLLFTDGLSNFGAADPSRLDAPLYIFSADATADHSFLRHLAMTTGGRYFNLKRMDDAAVVAAVGRSPYCFLSAYTAEGRAREVYPELPQPIAGRFTLVGKLAGTEAEVTLKYGYPGQPGERERTFTVSRDDAAEGSLLRRLWAQTKLADLMVAEKRNEKKIVRLGKQHGLVTPFTSLIVLDSLEQYVEHEIAPPKSLPEMRDEYMRQIDTLEHQNRKKQVDKLDAVIQMWNARVDWWNTEFKYPRDFRYRAEKEEEGEEEEDAMGHRPGPGAAPDMAPAEAAEPAPAMPQSPGPDPFAPAPAQEPRPMEYEAPAETLERFGGTMATERESSAPGALPPVTVEMALETSETTDRRAQPGIVIKPWDPDTPYMTELKAAEKDEAFGVYIKSREEYGTSPAFFLDCADHFFNNDQPALALQVLSNIAELELENPALLRVLAHRLAQLGYLDLAVLTFEQVLDLRPEEPQSYRDLALVLARRAEKQEATPDNAPPIKAAIRDDYARAIRLLNEVVLGEWDGRFAEIEVIALMELNAMLPKARAAGVKKIPVDERLVKLLDADVRIVMTWHADNTDIDLWVIEPSGEKAFYGHNRTTIGGLVSQDFTGGYGPEEYVVRKAQNGMYKIQANYFGSQATKLLGAVTVQVDVFTDFARPAQQQKSLTIRLKEAKETFTIGEIEF